MKFRKFIFPVLFVSGVLSVSAFAQKNTISGYVQDAETGEKLISANVFELNLQSGTATNNYGFFSLTLPASNKDSLTIVVSYIGYARWQKRFLLTKDMQLTINLHPVSIIGEDVVVTADKYDRIEKQSQMSNINIPIRQIEAVPALLGEADVLKAIQLLPGVQSGDEGNSGLYVRGGGPDQNLILLDGATVYNANHLFGFFSVFNSDAIKNVNLTKGGFSARYGGRLSSVLEINMKEGNNQKISGQGTIGLIASRFTLEGPLVKGRSSFIISGRRTYIDLLARPLMKGGNTGGYYFYDLNAKLNYSISNRDRLFLSVYTGDDKFYAKQKDKFDSQMSDIFSFGLGWGNVTSTVRWNHLFTQKLFSNTTLTYSDFTFKTDMKSSTEKRNKVIETFQADYCSGIRDFGLCLDFDYLPNPRHYIKFGGKVMQHKFNPGATLFKNKGKDIATIDTLIAPVKKHVTLAANVYFEDDFQLNPLLKLKLGVHTSLFSVKKKQYFSVEPRISLRYLIGNWAVKTSYVNMTQYIHLLSNSGIGLPTDLWVPATDKVKPLQGQQIGLGLARSFINNQMEFSIEGYYKTMNNLVAYKEGSSFIGLDTDWQNKIETGKGRSYGIELFLQKKHGKTTGWIGYTLSWTDRQFAGLNFGKRFPFRFDRRHDISLTMVHSFTKKIELSGSWIYGTGNAISLGIGRYNGLSNINNANEFQDIIYYNERNGFRMTAYHRLDLGLRFKWGQSPRTRIFTIGIYNAYSRRNPFFYYFSQKNNKKVLKQVSLFPIIPAISYSFKF